MNVSSGKSTRQLFTSRVTGILLWILFLACILMQGEILFAGQEGLLAEDPMVKISSQPIDKDIDTVLAGISKDVSDDTGIKQEYVTYYWQSLDSVHCMGKKTTEYPILVDFYVPGFFTNETIASFMTSLAAAIEKHTGVDKKWVFIHTHFPKQGQVYLSGKVMTWDDYQGKENDDQNPAGNTSTPTEANKKQ